MQSDGSYTMNHDYFQDDVGIDDNFTIIDKYSPQRRSPQRRLLSTSHQQTLSFPSHFPDSADGDSDAFANQTPVQRSLSYPVDEQLRNSFSHWSSEQDTPASIRPDQPRTVQSPLIPLPPQVQTSQQIQYTPQQILQMAHLIVTNSPQGYENAGPIVEHAQIERPKIASLPRRSGRRIAKLRSGNNSPQSMQTVQTIPQEQLSPDYPQVSIQRTPMYRRRPSVSRATSPEPSALSTAITENSSTKNNSPDKEGMFDHHDCERCQQYVQWLFVCWVIIGVLGTFCVSSCIFAVWSRINQTKMTERALKLAIALKSVESKRVSVASNGNMHRQKSQSVVNPAQNTPNNVYSCSTLQLSAPASIHSHQENTIQQQFNSQPLQQHHEMLENKQSSPSNLSTNVNQASVNSYVY